MQSIKEVPTTTAAISVYQQFSNKGNLQNCSPVYFQVFCDCGTNRQWSIHLQEQIQLTENVFIKSFLLSLKTKLDSNRCNAKIQKRRIFWLTFELMTAFTSSSVIRIFCYIWISNSIPNIIFLTVLLSWFTACSTLYFSLTISK